MAGKTHSRWTTISIGGQLVTCGINSIGGVGITWEQADVTTLCNEIMENLKGQGDVNLTIGGPFNNTATTGAHIVVQPLADGTAVTDVVIEIGINAAPTTGDPTFTITNAQIFDYMVQVATGSAVAWTAAIRGGEGVTVAWDVKA